MRWWPFLLVAMACDSTEPLGVYRFPVQTGPESLELRTFLLAGSGRELELFDGRDGASFARGDAGFSWGHEPRPYAFDAPKDYPLTIFLRDEHLEDAVPRPFATQPIAPLGSAADGLRRAVLESDGDRLELTIVGGQLYADRAAGQPESGETPPLLSVLNSVAGAGLVLPRAAAGGSEWRDAISTLVPTDATRPMPCGAAIVSVMRAASDTVETPAGRFEALKVTEAVDGCRHLNNVEVRVFRVERWFAPGVGPVRLLYVASDGDRRDYVLQSRSVQGDGEELWPLVKGNVWSYEVRGQRGAVLGEAEVRVTEERDVRLP